MSENVKIVPASCTQCGGTVEVDPGTEMAVCPFCGTSFIVEKAVNNYNVQHANIEHADNVNIDMTGSVKTVLDFVGDQMKESREERREARREAARTDREMSRGFLKIFGLMCAGMMVFVLVAFIVMQFTGAGEDSDGASDWEPDYVYSEDGEIACYIDWNGMLSVNIWDPGEYKWSYEKDYSTEKLKDEEADFDGYHFTVAPSASDGTGYATVSESKNNDSVFGDEEDDGVIDDESQYPESYAIVRFTFKGGKVTEINEIAHVWDISQYNFND